MCLFAIKKIMKKTFSVLLAFFAFFLFIGCSKSVIFDEKITFPDANWAFENKVITFKAPLEASEKPYTIILELELLGTPNVDKFNTAFMIYTPKGARMDKLLLFNFEQPQEPYIQGKATNEKIYRLTVFPKKYFSETGDYTMVLHQLSHNADNYPIRSLRIYIERVKE